MGMTYSKLSFMFPPLIWIGALPLLVEISFPINVNGSTTLDIGLLLKDSSPIKVASMFKPDMNPVSSLMPVPELPKSKKELGLENGFDLWLIETMFLSFFIDAPKLLRANIVEFGSSASKNPDILISQLRRDPIIKILCDIDLSPGHVISPDSELMGYDSKFKSFLL